VTPPVVVETPKPKKVIKKVVKKTIKKVAAPPIPQPRASNPTKYGSVFLRKTSVRPQSLQSLNSSRHPSTFTLPPQPTTPPRIYPIYPSRSSPYIHTPTLQPDPPVVIEPGKAMSTQTDQIPATPILSVDKQVSVSLAAQVLRNAATSFSDHSSLVNELNIENVAPTFANIDSTSSSMVFSFL
jgi:hypothetical protein